LLFGDALLFEDTDCNRIGDVSPGTRLYVFLDRCDLPGISLIGNAQGFLNRRLADPALPAAPAQSIGGAWDSGAGLGQPDGI
jgi:hypothetical protein